jgi:type I restriction enzyme M protein
MLAESHQKLADKIWSVANKLRGPYRPPQYRKVMLPLIVLRRLDCVLEPTKDAVLEQVTKLKAKKLSPEAIEKALAKVASKDREQPLFNTSKYTFQKLLGESAGIARNLTNYIKGFSPNVRKIFERFEFEAEIEKLDANNMLFEIIKEFANLDLHPNAAPNLEWGTCLST